ncbi:MAG TPA: hypothetical protein PK820_08875, partial [Candidatus Competibacteraceae bacterium]|nr:hypothetical protein [Candidatus Competibacteraceae bacterium]
LKILPAAVSTCGLAQSARKEINATGLFRECAVLASTGERCQRRGEQVALAQEIGQQLWGRKES